VRKRKSFGVWLPLTLIAPVLAATFIGSAMAEFKR
jgi:hypothetical protein